MPRSEIEKKLARILARAAPRKAVRGEWNGTALQMGVAERGGGFLDEQGERLDLDDDQILIMDEVDALIFALDEAENAEAPVWNVFTLHWSKTFGRAELRTSFDPARVPLAADDPVLEQAAEARRAFWSRYGEIAGYAENDRAVNEYNQTPIFLGPHERVIIVRREASVILATDGLSTPWPGTSERVNGFGCEAALELAWPLDRAFDRDNPDDAAWIELVLLIGDKIIDAYGDAEREIETHGAILLADVVPQAPLPGLHLAMTRGAEAGLADEIPGLPFGPAKLYAVTALRDEDFAGLDLNAPGWAPEQARLALERYEKLGLGRMTRR